MFAGKLFLLFRFIQFIFWLILVQLSRYVEFTFSVILALLLGMYLRHVLRILEHQKLWIGSIRLLLRVPNSYDSFFISWYHIQFSQNSTKSSPTEDIFITYIEKTFKQN